ncbi:hypothetical protein OROGR_021141 [Orobanche gracilis]
MAEAEQPLKKQKLYEPPPPSSPPPQPALPPPPPQDPPPQPPQPSAPLPMSYEEILRRRRCQEEIRTVFECYKRIKFCIDQKDKRFRPELEEAYLSLITASGDESSASAKRLAAEYIPRYASYCPTALEAAAEIVLNIHGWCFAVISRGEDIHGLAFETAKACILGLVDICKAAASESPTSAVIQGIRSAVFLSVFTFLVSSFEGNDVFNIVDKRVLKIYEVAESFSGFSREFLEEDNAVFLKLSKFRALSFLRILFSCPKYSLVAGFELFESTGMEGIQKGNYFLRQLTTELDDIGVHLDERCNDESSVRSSRTKCDDKHPNDDRPPPKLGSSSNCTLKKCLLWLVLSRDLSFKSLIFSRYKKLCDSASSEVVSDVTSVLEGVFESFLQQVKAEDNQVDSSEHNSGSSRARTPRELLNRQSFSPRARTPRDFRSNSFNARNHSAQMEKSPITNMDLHLPALRSSNGPVNSPFDSPKQNIHPPNAIGYSDGDPTAIDIYPVSKKLWVGSLGPETTEMLLRYQFEKFGYIEQLQYIPFKGFATIEYRNILDVIKAREVMQGRSPWGACLQIKFMDAGLGTRGAINGTAVGSSCHIYIGNVSSIWAKDEVMHEVNKVLHKGPRMVFDLGIEGALLMEFDSPEEAAMMIGHLRWHRKENSSFFPPSNVDSPCVMEHAEAAKPASASVHVDTRYKFPSNNLIGSPPAQNMLVKPPDRYVTRTSGLSSLLLRLRAKYNITHSQCSSENHSPGFSMREQEQVPTNTLSINIPNKTALCITDDEVLTVCNLAINNAGSIVCLSRTSMPAASCWVADCSSVDAANTLLQNLRECPGNFFQLEFSNSAKHHATASLLRPNSSSLELTSPRISQGNSGPMMQTAYTYQSTWSGGGISEVGRTEQSLMYGKPESGMRPGGSIVSIHGHAPGSYTPHPFQTSTFNRPSYPPLNRWDPHGLSHHPPPKPILPVMTTNSSHANMHVTPFLPASVTPLAQIPGRSMSPPFDHMFSLPVLVPPPLSSLPPPSNVAPVLPPQSDYHPHLPPDPELQPPLPPAPPPLPPPPPHAQPPPPPPPSVGSDTESCRSAQHYPWQGILSKSGVHYCAIHAQRVDSDICNYSTAIGEPAEWPAKLDMTKRTDIQHVKSTFSSTPPHRVALALLLEKYVGCFLALMGIIRVVSGFRIVLEAARLCRGHQNTSCEGLLDKTNFYSSILA